MSNVEGSFSELKGQLRSVLGLAGVASNPAVSAEWVIEQIRTEAHLPNVQDLKIDGDFNLLLAAVTQILTESGKEIPQIPDDNLNPLLNAIFRLMLENKQVKRIRRGPRLASNPRH